MSRPTRRLVDRGHHRCELGRGGVREHVPREGEGRARHEACLQIGADRVAGQGRALESLAPVTAHVAEDQAHPPRGRARRRRRSRLPPPPHRPGGRRRTTPGRRSRRGPPAPGRPASRRRSPSSIARWASRRLARRAVISQRKASAMAATSSSRMIGLLQSGTGSGSESAPPTAASGLPESLCRGAAGAGRGPRVAVAVRVVAAGVDDAAAVCTRRTGCPAALRRAVFG